MGENIGRKHIGISDEGSEDVWGKGLPVYKIVGKYVISEESTGT